MVESMAASKGSLKVAWRVAWRVGEMAESKGGWWEFSKDSWMARL
jgi:hypothetical protein